MEALNASLERELDALAKLKRDLEGVEELLDEKPLDTNNIIGCVD